MSIPVFLGIVVFITVLVIAFSITSEAIRKINVRLDNLDRCLEMGKNPMLPSNFTDPISLRLRDLDLKVKEVDAGVSLLARQVDRLPQKKAERIQQKMNELKEMVQELDDET